MTAPVMALGSWRSNGEMIADVARLYLHDDWHICDPTFGLGRWWTHWQPHTLDASDLDPTKNPSGESLDARHLDAPDGYYDAVALDPPYKLNGTPTACIDQRYGVHEPTTVAGRHQLMADMLTEAARVTRPDGIVLFKCQAQVNGGKVRWQPDMFTRHADTCGLSKLDEFLFPSYRPQPDGRAQVHARRGYSTLLVFVKGRQW